jgi:pyrimidine oxygenase
VAGDEHFRNRYTMLGEYAHISCASCWATGDPTSKANIIRWTIAASAAARRRHEDHLRGLVRRRPRFLGQMADYAFCLGKGVNTPQAFAFNNERLAVALEKTGATSRCSFSSC